MMNSNSILIMTGWKPIYQLLSDFRSFEILCYLSTRPLISNLRKSYYFSVDCCCSAIQTVRRILLPPPQHQPQSLWPWGVPLPVHLSQWSHLQPKVFNVIFRLQCIIYTPLPGHWDLAWVPVVCLVDPQPVPVLTGLTSLRVSPILSIMPSEVFLVNFSTNNFHLANSI